MVKARHRLQALRRQRYTQAGLAEQLHLGVSTVRDWEQGYTTPSPDNRRALAEALGVTDAELSLLLDTGDPTAPNGHKLPEWLDTYAGLEQEASRIWAHEPLVVHGLLQTRQYARAVEEADPRPKASVDIAQRVEFRVVRQAVLDRIPAPLHLTVVLGEASLRQVAGDETVMADQLHHLATATERPNVDIRVLPFDAGVFAAAWGAFSLMASTRDVPSMAFVENRTGMSWLNKPWEIDPHMRLFGHLLDVALPQQASVDFIRKISKESYR